MDSNRIVRIVAGTFVLLSLALGTNVPWNPFFHSPYWLGFTAFVGLNLLQSGFTQWCLLETMLWKLGVKRPCEIARPEAKDPGELVRS